MLYYIYFDRLTQQYEICQSRETGLLGTYLDKERGVGTPTEFVFAVFTRAIDASGYVKAENARRVRV